MPPTTENRPSPDALLDQANREARGKLKIFLGAAPGVGKTYSMLRAAQARKRENIDVLVGIVETHKRSETDALLQGLDALPRQDIDYRGLKFEEMDIDAVLRRHPQLVLVDELAHSNIPGARHPKRYQDVEELLDAGIDVYTTLNVQHVESLNDIVARITGVTVRETVPDSIVQSADSIELIDLTPEELLQRLREGKIYIPEQARLAMNRFFTPGNLTALRELALRQAAERVDDQMTSYMRQHAIEGPWPASERILVCLTDDGQGHSLIRTAKRSAERRQTEWIALYIETHRHNDLPEAKRREIAQTLHMAESLGGLAMTVAGEDIPSEVLRIARERNVSTIIIGKSRRSVLSRIMRPSVAAAVLDRGDTFDILVMSGENRRAKPDKTDLHPTETGSIHARVKWTAYIEAIVTTAIATGIAWVAAPFTDITTVSYIYLIAVLLIAVDRGFRISSFTSVLSFFTIDYLFTEPHYSFLISRRGDFLALSFFLVVALAISLIGHRLLAQVRVTRRNAARTQVLYDFNKTIAAAVTHDDVLQAVVNHTAASLNARVALLLPQSDRLEVAAAMPPETRLDTASNAAMDWAWRHGRPAGLNSDTLPGAPFYGLPLRTRKETVGVLALRPEYGAFSPEQEHFIASLANQSAIAIERAQLATDIAQARLQTENERMRSSLLSTISHDLRTPLVAIQGATSSLRDYWDELSDQTRHELFNTIVDESGRLNRFVQNLLDMTQLVTGALKLKLEKIVISNLVGHVLDDLCLQLGNRPLRVDVPADLPQVEGDFAILERALGNVIDNACKYSSADQPLAIIARREAHFIRITVIDRGPGIPEDERERVFDMFYRLKIDPAPSGAGLGLAICRGFIEAHGGSIAAQTGPDGIGSQIVIRLPAMKEG